jgi:hypothetical protein
LGIPKYFTADGNIINHFDVHCPIVLQFFSCLSGNYLVSEDNKFALSRLASYA